MYRCRICGNESANQRYIVREMMLGTKEEFSYFQCAQCACLQIAEIPADVSGYYPAAYYSFSPPAVRKLNPVVGYLKKLRLRYWLSHEGIVGAVLARYVKKPEFLSWMAKANVRPESKILDVGSGAGEFLAELYNYGFSDLTGIDKNIPEETHYPCGIRIVKQDLAGMKGSLPFDVITLNHSLEHMPDQAEALKKVREMLLPGSHALVRIPLVDSLAWRTYGTDWVQLDAPRHFYLHSKKSLAILARDTGFKIVDVVFDSTEFQFWGSEQYKAGMPLMDERSYSKNPARSPFSAQQIATFKARSADLNRQLQGDMACFLLQSS